MEFTIYDLSDFLDEELQNFNFEEESDLPEIEMGLSAGEIRQSLLDRFREEVRTETAQFINMNLSEYGVNIKEDDLDSEDEKQLIKSEIENTLYDLDDEELNDSTWHFASEIIYIRGEEW